MPTTAREAVVDPVSREPSRMRTMSPPMLLGRKLLKKVAIRYEAVSCRIGAGQPRPPSRSCQRQAASASMADVEEDRRQQVDEVGGAHALLERRAGPWC